MTKNIKGTMIYSGIPEDLLELYTSYQNELIKNNVPVIYEILHLSKLLGIEFEYLRSVVFSSHDHYRKFSIPKRSGGRREILVPYPKLLLIQKWINENILQKVKTSINAHAYKKNHSIITNASKHLNQDNILKVDIKDFFPNIKINSVIYLFKNLGYTQDVALFLAKICTYRGYLPQGAPTSPTISNIVSKRLDKRLWGLANKYKLKYTRYADDIVFSGENLPAHLLYFVKKIIDAEGHMINLDKTKEYYKSERVIITGLNVSGEKLTVPRSYKRALRNDVYHVISKGLESHITNRKIKRIDYPQSLIGKLRYWQQIEPDNDFVSKYIEKIKHILI